MYATFNLSPALSELERARFDAGSRLRELVRFAVRAPSSHNTQPWLFRVRGDTLELFADRARSLPVVDPGDRALIMSCGAALGYLRVAIRNYGYSGEIEQLPDPERPDLLARVRLGEPRRPTLEDELLFDAIAFRRTNRGEYLSEPLPDILIGELAAMALAEGVWLRVVTSPRLKSEIAQLVAEGTRVQASSPKFRQELSGWVRPNSSTQHDGIPAAAYGVSNAPSLVFPWFIRAFDWGDAQAEKDARRAARAPALGVLGTDSNGPDEWLRAGEALSRLLLRAAAAGVSASFLNQPIEVVELRPCLAGVLRLRGHPQLLFRLGIGKEAAAAPRRTLEEVMML